MKKISIILVISLLSVLFLCACGTAEKSGEAESTHESTAEVKETDPTLDTSYDIETVGEKDENVNGEVIGDCHFQKAVFTNPNVVLTKINDEINEECNKFFSEGMGEQYDEYFSALSDEAKEGLSEQPYTATYDVKDVYIDDNYVSIVYEWNWFAGGVSNRGSIGFNFDINTGEKLSYEDLFASEDEAKAAFQNAVNALIDASPESFFEDAEDTVSNYDTDNVKFSIGKDMITVYIDQYEIAPGASGAFTVEISR